MKKEKTIMKVETTDKHYIYIGQYSMEKLVCKIGITSNLDERLASYNAHKTGKSTNNQFSYLFTCEVSDMRQVENDIKEEFKDDRENANKEIYFYNPVKFEKYVNFIKNHKLFVKEIFIKTEPKPIIKEVIVKKTTPSLETRGLSRVDIINSAKKIKNDEFYTQYEDIEKEISMYSQENWKDKVVFCNCDDALDETDKNKSSAFAWYFYKNFEKLQLKKLICTHYSGGVDLFRQGKTAYIAYIYTITNNGLTIEKETPKDYTGSFDDPISLKILNEESDIVCTNPPFSRAIDYWKLVIESGKKFLIISNHTNTITNAFIPYFKSNKVWAGYNEVLWYLNPKKELAKASGYWFTNFPITDRPKYKNLKIVKLKEIPAKYKKYDDEKVLFVDHNYIPSDYKEPFAVSAYPIVSGILEKGYEIVQEKGYKPYIEGKYKFSRVLIQKR